MPKPKRQGDNYAKHTRRKKTYKSPPRKLVKFFEQSRNQWKAKYQEAQCMVKRLKNRVRFLEKSRARWKQRAKELEVELGQLKAQVRTQEKGLATLKQKMLAQPQEPGCVTAFQRVPAHHQYSLGQIMLFLSLVLSAAASLRGASRTMEIIIASLQLPWKAPSWFTGRLWLLRLGYYKLTRPKEKAADWVWIVDHTVQLGAEKCLVILGLRLAALPPVGRYLSHADVEPLALLPVTHSNGMTVWQQLEATIAKTGVPREIISDHGSDLKAGVEKFCDAHPETCAIYDIKHKTAALLKQELKDDTAWTTFTQLAAQTKRSVQQTALAALAPPNQRTKARYMNVDTLIHWGRQMLIFLDQQAQETSAEFDPAQVAAKLGWLPQFRTHLEEWHELLQLTTTTESLVRKHDISHGCRPDLQKRLGALAHTARTKKVRTQLLAFVAAEASKAKPNERLLGSSEVIESVLGKLKRLERDQAKNGFTSLVLSVAAMLSPTTSEVVLTALETVSTQQVLAWSQETLGKSVQAKRRAAFALHNRTEQNRDQFRMAV